MAFMKNLLESQDTLDNYDDERVRERNPNLLKKETFVRRFFDGDEQWMEEARGIAAQCWCDPETEDREMDVVLGEAFAKRLAGWMEIAAQNQRNTDYYRGLLVRCGKAIGQAAYIQDDGGKAQDVLCAKVPELVEALCGNSAQRQ